MSRGYFAIGIVAGKTPENTGSLWRGAHAFGAAYVYTVGHRYPAKRQPGDTSDATKTVPLFAYADTDAFLAALPATTVLVGVEYGKHLDREPIPLPKFTHPERAVYLLGAEDHGIPADLQKACNQLVYVPTLFSLNVAVTGSLIMYDRTLGRKS
jgi:tRNA(Leu) C34 or U34 (ribose-2'-O)-methylase TrmL